MSEKFDKELATIAWLQNMGIALFATGFVILGFTYVITGNVTSFATGLMSIHNISNATINSELVSVGQQAHFQEAVLTIAGMIALAFGLILIISSACKLRSLRSSNR